MQSIFVGGVFRSRWAAIALLVAFATACGVENQDMPKLAGPSELALSLVPSASPDQLTRDGSSQSTVTVKAFGPDGKLRSGQRIALGIAGTSALLSTSDVITGPDGNATFTVTAPPLNVPGDAIIVVMTPIGTNAENTVRRTVSIGVTPSNPSAPVADFTFLPEKPGVNELVAFDASTSTDEGPPCGGACSYSWDFGDGSSGSGLAVGHAYPSPGNKFVTLTVADWLGATSTKSRAVPVQLPAPPLADFTASPASPMVGALVTFDATASTVGAGAAIVDYRWNFGDGSATFDSADVPAATKTYAAAGAFVVTLRITDNLGRTASKAVTVTVVP